MKQSNFLLLCFIGFASPFAAQASAPGLCQGNRSSYEFPIPQYEAFGTSDFANINPLILISDDAPTGDEELPKEWDWRNQQGANWLTPVKTQMGCGDCTMQAVSSTIEAQLKIDSSWPWWDPEISVAEGFYCGGGHCINGWTVESALQRGLEVGFMDRTCGEQIKSAEDCSRQECSASNQRRWKLNGIQKVTDGTVDITAIRRALLKGPVLSSMTLPEDFHCYHWGVYKREPGVGFKNIGHSLAIVGYSDKRKAWIVKNSWGDKWVDKGFGYLYVRDTTNFGTHSWILDTRSNSGLVEIEGLNEHDVLAGQKELTLHLQGNQIKDTEGASVLQLNFKKQNQIVLSKSCQGPTCKISVDTTELENGAYEIFAEAQDSQARSMVKSAQVLNGSPNWTPLTTLLTTSTAKAQIARDSFTLPIPFQVKPSEIAIRFLDKDGKLLLEQTTRTIPTKLLVKINREFVPKNTKALEFWFYLAGQEPFRYFRTELAKLNYHLEVQY